MLQTGEYTTYKEFGNDLIQKLEEGDLQRPFKCMNHQNQRFWRHLKVLF